MRRRSKSGALCPNEQCEFHRRRDEDSIVLHGFSKVKWGRRRRYRCTACGRTVQRDIDGIEVWQAGCNGYYRSPSGRVVTQWPHTMTEFRVRRFRKAKRNDG